MPLCSRAIVLMITVPLFLLFISSHACFSSTRGKRRLIDGADANADEKAEHSIQSLDKMAMDKKSIKENGHDNSGGLKKPAEPRLTDKFVSAYLREYGYTSTGTRAKAISRFQEFIGVRPATGEMDLSTTAAMVRKRCENKDVSYHEELTLLWEKSSLRYSIRGIAAGGIGELSERDLKELIRQAFSAWEIVISMDFVEVPASPPNNDTIETADIEFVFDYHDDVPQPKWQRNTNNTAYLFVENLVKTGLGVASSTPPTHSRITIAAREPWSTFQVQADEGKLDIFLVLIHQIGHALGMRHSSDRTSVMYPIFEREVGEQLPVISSKDVELLRSLYDPNDSEIMVGGSHQITDEEELINGKPTATRRPSTTEVELGATVTLGTDALSTSTAQPTGKKCPNRLTAATQLFMNGMVYIFNETKCWQFDPESHNISEPRSITEMFPDSPERVEVAVSSGPLTVLISERMLYGYEWKEHASDGESGGKFKPADGYPRPLHSRVLFFPRAAFPLLNESVILLADNVFATYDLHRNEPTMLNDKNVFFPNLPDNLRAGILQVPGSERSYYMLTEDQVYVYDTWMRKSIISVRLQEFLSCDGRWE